MAPASPAQQLEPSEIDVHGAAARKPPVQKQGRSPVQKQGWPGLAHELAGFDDDGLAKLLTLRPDLARPAPRDIPSLTARASAWPSARDCYHRLDGAAQRVVEALCLLGPGPTVADLAALLGVEADDADLAAALPRLQERALAFGSGGPADRVHLLPILRQLDYPARLGPPMASVLTSPPGPPLDQVAARVGALPSRTKGATLAAIAGAVADPVAVARLVDEGPSGTGELARRVATDGPLVRIDGGVYRVNDATPAGWLLNRGLLVVVDYFTAQMPREPAVALRGGRAFPAGCLRRPEAVSSPVEPDAVDRAAAEQSLRLVADVAVAFDLWEAEPPTVLKAGGIGIREVHRVAKATGRTDTTAARLVELAAVAGLVRVDHHSGLVLPTVAYDDWVALDAAARWALLAGPWVDAALHLSLAGAISTKDKPIPPLLDRAPERDAALRRRTVLAALEAAPPGTALEPAALRALVEWQSPAVWAGGPAPSALLISWVLQEADLLGVAALGALSSAGRAVVAGHLDDAVAALGRLAPPTVTEFVVQADLTAMVAGDPAPAVRSELELLADVESKGAATVYRFSEQSLRRGFDAGRTAAGIIDFLEGHATRGVPQPLSYLVADLGRRFANVRVGAVTSYVRSDEPSLLAEVLQAKRTAKLRLRRLAPTVLVTDVDAATVVATLQAVGYLPAREGPDGALLLTRRPARRAPEKARSLHVAPAPPDVGAIVAELRRRPASAPAPAPPAPRFEAPGLQPSLLAVAKPIEIAKDPRAVRALIREACDEFWVVRLSYVNGKGQSTEMTVEPLDLDDAGLYAACFPHGNERTLVVDRIEWARVLTDAEEELLP